MRELAGVVDVITTTTTTILNKVNPSGDEYFSISKYILERPIQSVLLLGIFYLFSRKFHRLR